MHIKYFVALLTVNSLVKLQLTNLLFTYIYVWDDPARPQLADCLLDYTNYVSLSVRHPSDTLMDCIATPFDQLKQSWCCRKEQKFLFQKKFDQYR